MDDRMTRDDVAAPPHTLGSLPHSPRRIDEACIVGVGEYQTLDIPGQLVCIGLGSCVGIAIFDPQVQIGGLAHAMLPRYEEGRDKVNAAKYADSSIMLMVDELVEMGAERGRLRAKIAGGAQMFSFMSSDTLNIGQRNSEAARATLKAERIRLLGETYGHVQHGRRFVPRANGQRRLRDLIVSRRQAAIR